MLTHAKGSVSVLVLPPQFTFLSMLIAVGILSPPMLLVDIESMLSLFISLMVV